jgi:hypothetical protein
VFVCAYAFAQDAASLKGPLSGSLSQAASIRLADAVPPAGTDENTNLAVQDIEPDRIMPFVESDEGEYFTLLKYDSQIGAAVRFHFSSFQLPENARVFVYGINAGGQPSRIAGPYERSGPSDSGDFWTGAMPRGTVIIELQVTGEPLPDLPFRIDALAINDSIADTEAPALKDPAFRDMDTKDTEPRTAVFRGRIVEHIVRDGEAIMEGDMILGAADELQPANSSTSKSNDKSAVAISYSFYRWPNGIIPYIVDASAPNKTWISQAINHWNTKLSGVIRLVPRTSQNDYVKFVSGSGCSSFVGRIWGPQTIKLSGACDLGSIIHEIGHAVGLYHEQAREDRNSWVKILSGNIIATAIANFNQEIYSSDDLIYYAYNSIMHYPVNAFSLNGKPTIETIPPGIPVGQRAGLDVSDIAAVRKMYGKTTAEVAISSVPVGLTLTVDGVRAVTPIIKTWSVGSVHTISAPSYAPSTIVGSQYTLTGWTDRGSQTHTIVVPTTGLTVAANYALRHKLTASTSSATAGAVTVSPVSPTQTYTNQSTVEVTATPSPNYCFSSWTGLAGGTPSTTSITLKKGYDVRANFIAGAVTPAVASLTLPKAGGTFKMNIAATAGCGWTIQSTVDWITVSKSYATSSSPGFTYKVQANPTSAARYGTLRIDGKMVAMRQTGN